MYHFDERGKNMERKKMIKLIIGTLAVITLIIGFITAVSADEPDGSTPEAIIEFLGDNGYTVSSPVTKKVTIPSEFSDVYENYNKLQKEQGFDLSKYKGETAVSYTFTVIGYVDENGETQSNVQAHVLVCDGKIIGGDIASTELDGFMTGIR